MATALRHEFSLPSDPATVFEILTDSKYLTEKVALADSGNFEISGICPNFEINMIRTTARQFPPMVAKFIGDNLVVKEIQNWKQISESEFTAKFILKIPNAPVNIEGQIHLIGIEKDMKTNVTISGQVKVNIPFLGAAAEPQVLNEITKVISEEEALCRKWLT